MLQLFWLVYFLGIFPEEKKYLEVTKRASSDSTEKFGSPQQHSGKYRHLCQARKVSGHFNQTPFFLGNLNGYFNFF